VSKYILMMVDKNVSFAAAEKGLSQFCEHVDRLLDEINCYLTTDSAEHEHLQRRSVHFAPDSLHAELGNHQIAAVMLFGHNTKLPASNLDKAAFETYVKSGGRAFATGDHAWLGSHIAGELYGISVLRKWSGPDIKTMVTNDTRIRPSLGEEDAFPKAIYPNWSWGPQRRVHPLMDYEPGLPICFLPDHAHEGALGPQPCFEQWSIHDVAHAVVRIASDCYKPVVVPVIRIAQENPRGARLIVDSTIHHWLNENWTPLRDTSYFKQVKAVTTNLLIQLIPEHYLEILERVAARLLLRDANLREDPEAYKLVAHRALAEQPLLWRVMRERLKAGPILGGCQLRLQEKAERRGLDPVKWKDDRLTETRNFEDDLAEFLFLYTEEAHNTD